MIRNPNNIVDRLVEDFNRVAGGRILSITMYGDAVSHEYRPGESKVDILIVLNDVSMDVLTAFSRVQAFWMRRGISSPLYLSPVLIESLIDIFPLEFLDMRHAYRVLYGEDFLADLRIKKNSLRLQCERELACLALHLRLEFVGACRDARKMKKTLALSMRRLNPILKGILAVYERKIPTSSTDLISAVEDICGLEASVLYNLYNSRPTGNDIKERFGKLLLTIEKLEGQIENYGHDSKETAENL